MNEERRNIIIKWTLFLVFLIIGILNFKNYGLTIDEGSCNEIGRVNFNEYNKFFAQTFNVSFKFPEKEKIVNIQSFVDKDYPPFFEVIIIFVTCIYCAIKGDYASLMMFGNEIHYIRHFLIHFYFVVSLIFLYDLVYKRFKNIWISLFVVLIVYLHPRIFADSFYNSKDIPFFCANIFVLWSLQKYMFKKSWVSLLVFSLMVAIACGTRIGAVIFLPVSLVVILFNEDSLKERIIKNIVFFIFFFIILYLIFPYLWKNPISGFLEAIATASNFRWINEVMYRGNLIYSNNLPWHYSYNWIIITTPVFILVLFLIGLFIYIVSFINTGIQFWKDKSFVFDTIIVSVLFVFLFKVTFTKTVLYDAWRQLFFLYVFIAYISCIGLNFLYNKKRTPIVSILAILFAFQIYWNVKNNPYQNVYFNFLAQNPQLNYELDYWGNSNVNIFKFLKSYCPNKTVNIYSNNRFVIYNKGFAQNDNSYKLVENIDSADIAIGDFRFMDKNTRLHFLNNTKQFEGKTIFETSADNKLVINKVIELKH